MKKIKPKKEEEVNEDNNNDNEYMEPVEKEENKFVANEENQNNERLPDICCSRNGDTHQ